MLTRIALAAAALSSSHSGTRPNTRAVDRCSNVTPAAAAPHRHETRPYTISQFKRATRGPHDSHTRE